MDKKDKCDIDWAILIDLIASEYGWTIDYIVNNLDMGQLAALIVAIKKRYQRQNPKSKYPSIPQELDGIDKEIPMSDFIKMGGKLVEKDGKKQIIL